MRITAEMLKTLRKQKGKNEGRKISQQVLAAEINVPRGTISSWEAQGGYVKKSDDVKKLVAYFGLPENVNYDADDNLNITSEIEPAYKKLTPLTEDDLQKLAGYMHFEEWRDKMGTQPLHELFAEMMYHINSLNARIDALEQDKQTNN